VQENNWFSERGAGVYFGRTRPQKPDAETAWANLPPNVIFVLEDGFGVCSRYNKKVPSGGT
jgi:hypothetical protein